MKSRSKLSESSKAYLLGHFRKKQTEKVGFAESQSQHQNDYQSRQGVRAFTATFFLQGVQRGSPKSKRPRRKPEAFKQYTKEKSRRY